MSTEKDDEVMAINEKLEVLVEEMSNTKSATLIGALNNYPVIPVSAHIRPFHIYWLNLVAGIIFPVGLFSISVSGHSAFVWIKTWNGL